MGDEDKQAGEAGDSSEGHTTAPEVLELKARFEALEARFAEELEAHKQAGAKENETWLKGQLEVLKTEQLKEVRREYDERLKTRLGELKQKLRKESFAKQESDFEALGDELKKSSGDKLDELFREAQTLRIDKYFEEAPEDPEDQRAWLETRFKFLRSQLEEHYYENLGKLQAEYGERLKDLRSEASGFRTFLEKLNQRAFWTVGVIATGLGVVFTALGLNTAWDAEKLMLDGAKKRVTEVVSQSVVDSLIGEQITEYSDSTVLASITAKTPSTLSEIEMASLTRAATNPRSKSFALSHQLVSGKDSLLTPPQAQVLGRGLVEMLRKFDSQAPRGLSYAEKATIVDSIGALAHEEAGDILIEYVEKSRDDDVQVSVLKALPRVIPAARYSEVFEPVMSDIADSLENNTAEDSRELTLERLRCVSRLRPDDERVLKLVLSILDGHSNEYLKNDIIVASCLDEKLHHGVLDERFLDWVEAGIVKLSVGSRIEVGRKGAPGLMLKVKVSGSGYSVYRLNRFEIANLRSHFEEALNLLLDSEHKKTVRAGILVPLVEYTRALNSTHPGLIHEAPIRFAIVRFKADSEFDCIAVDKEVISTIGSKQDTAETRELPIEDIESFTWYVPELEGNVLNSLGMAEDLP